MSAPLTGPVLAKTSKSIAGRAVPPAAVVTEIIGLVKDVVTTISNERIARARIAADLQGDLAQIRATEKLLLTYLDQNHDERTVAFTRYFDALDAALAAGDPALVAPVLNGIVALAQTNPFANLTDLAAVRSRLKDPETEWAL